MAATIHLAYGDEYLALAKAKALVEASVPDPKDPLAVDIVDGQCDTVDESVNAVARCLEALGTLGFFGGRKVVWFRGVNFLTDTPTGRSERVKVALARLTETLKRGLAEGVVLVVSSPKVDRRSAFYKQIHELGAVHEFAAPEKPAQAREHVYAVVDRALEESGLKLAGEAREVFVERMGGDTRTIIGEVLKLATYVGGERPATVADVEAITSPSRDAVSWDIQDAVGNRQLDRALAIMRRLLFQREQPIGLIALIENRIRDLMVYRESLDRGWLRVSGGRGNAVWASLPPAAAEVLSEGLGKDYQGMHPFRLGLLARQAQSFSGAELARARMQAMATHRQLVTSAIPGPLALELLLLRILARRPAAARA